MEKAPTSVIMTTKAIAESVLSIKQANGEFRKGPPINVRYYTLIKGGFSITTGKLLSMVAMEGDGVDFMVEIATPLVDGFYRKLDPLHVHFLNILKDDSGFKGMSMCDHATRDEIVELINTHYLQTHPEEPV